MLGREQAYDQPKPTLRWAYQTLGEVRYPMRMRARYVLSWVPRGFQPRAVWDAGCGPAELTFELARRYPQAWVLGTDLNERWVLRGRALAARTRLRNVSFEQEDLREVGHPGAFDLVVCCDVLEHVDDDQAAGRHLAESLSAGGRLLVHVPARGRFQSPRFAFRRWKRPSTVDPAHLDRGRVHVREGYTPTELSSLLEACGLRVGRWRWTFGSLAMGAYTLHEVLEQRRLAYCVVAFPLLMAVGALDDLVPHRDGAGLLVWASGAV
jgi:trans-aconitate methyltransferase